MKIIAGLGNPGPQYEKTRHNAGRIILDQLMNEYQTKPFSLNKERNAMVGEMVMNNEKILTLKPLSYMNRSGAAIKSASSYYKISVSDILILHDEIDREFGRIGLKSGGSHAGHNGLRDTITHLGTNTFDRIRIGVDRPADKSQVADYVLSNLSKEQLGRLQQPGYDLLVQILHHRLSKKSI